MIDRTGVSVARPRRGRDRGVLCLAALLLTLGACTLTPEQEAWNKQHHVWDIPLTPGAAPGAASPFNDKNYDDPHPHSDSDDAQRAAYQAHQDEQRNAATPDFRSGFTDGMTCNTTSSFSGTANSGTSTSSQSCHN